MLNENGNILFELMRFNCDVDFYNINNFTFAKAETIKTMLISQLSTLVYNYNNINAKYYMRYLTTKTKLDNEFLLASKINFRLKFVILSDNEDKMKYITKFNSDLNKETDLVLKAFTKLVIVSNFYYNELMNKLQNDKNYKAPSEEMSVIYSPDSIEMLKSIVNSTLIGFVNYHFNTVQSKGQLIQNKGFVINKYAIIKERICEYIQLHCYDIAIAALKLLSEMVTVNKEKIKIKEYLALCYYLNNVFVNKDKVVFNREIENLFLSALDSYKKAKEDTLRCECMLRLSTYYASFDSVNDKFKHMVNKTYFHSQNLEPEKQLEIDLKLGWLFHERKMYRKENLNIYLCFNLCFQYIEKLKHMLPILLRKIQDNFNIIDIEKNTIMNIDMFNEIHNRLLKSQWKKIEINLCEKGNDGKYNIVEYTKKKMEKGSKIVVKRQYDKIRQFVIRPYWFGVQQNIYLCIINYFKSMNNYTKAIAYALSYLQTLVDDLPKVEQKNIIKGFKTDSLLMQNKLNLSLTRFPILIRVIPISSNIKFDITKNPKVNGQQEQLFLYNPWEKNATINYYWTQNSYQNISVQFYNNLKTEITLTKIRIIFANSNKDDKNKQTIISYPSTVTIAPSSIVDIKVKNHPINQGLVDILGVRYELMNSQSNQYVDSNGNGLYYSCENIFNDSTIKRIGPGTKKKKLINLKNIKIYPEIPILEIKVLDNSINSYDDSISLFEHQEYTFSFLLENTGKYNIDEIKCNVYGYKKEDYKVNLKEINIKGENGIPLIKPGESYKIDYSYLHKSSHLKIEFRVYYISKDRNAEAEKDEVFLKPYLLYAKIIHTEKLLEFSHIKLMPKLASLSIGEIAKYDKRLNRRFNYIYCADMNIFSMTISNSNQNKMSLKFIDKDNNIVKEDIIKKNYSKEITFDCPLDTDFMKMILKWNFITTEDCLGTIDLKEIFNDYTHILRKRECDLLFSIDISSHTDENEIEYDIIKYKVTNQSKRTLTQIKMYVYFYLFYDGNYIFNDFLSKDTLFYEGNLVQLPKGAVKEGEDFTNEIKVYKNDKTTSMRTSMVVVDKEKEIVYMSPFDRYI